MKSLHVACVWCAVVFAQDTRAQAVPGWVVIPVNEYSALRSRAYPSAPQPESALPLDATLTRVDYDLHLESGIATGRASITVDVLKDGWVRVAIPPGLLVREARIGPNLVSLTPAGKDGQLAAVLSHRGRSVLDLDVAFTVGGNAAEERLSLPAGVSGITRAAVTRAPQNNTEVKVQGGLLSEESPTHWLAFARGNEPLVFTWSRKAAEQPRAELPLRMRGTLTQLFGLGEDSTTLTADVALEVSQGLARQVRVAVPPNVTINQVPGATIADWDVKNGELTINLLEPVDRSVKFAINGETHLARDGDLEIPLLRLLDCERESGGAAVEVLGAGEIKDRKPQGMDPADAAELGSPVAARQSPSLAAFRLRAGNGTRSLHVTVARYAQQAVLTANVEEARYRLLLSVDGKMLVQARYALRSNQRTFMRMALPPGAAVWSSSLSGRPVHPGKAPDGSLLFPLEKGHAGEDAPLFTIEVLYLTRGNSWTPKGRADLPLPVLDLPVSRTGVMLFYPPQFRVTAQAGAFHEQAYEPPAADAWSVASPSASVTLNAPPATQALLDSYRDRSNARKAAAASPVRLTFPAVGPSLYLVSQLTGEGKPSTIALDYQKDRKGGVK